MTQNYRHGLGVAALFLTLTFFGCSADYRISRTVNKYIRHADLFKKHQIGIAIYDRKGRKMLYEKNADRYFVPASNTKLFTFYGLLKMFPDQLPALRYIEEGDSLIFWGTGDPSFLQSSLRGTAAFNFLAGASKKIFFAPGRYSGSPYGKGWQWDDYNDYYQAEINELPIMDNLLSIKVLSDTLQVVPAHFFPMVRKDTSANGARFNVQRDYDQNIFTISYGVQNKVGRQQAQVPYKVSLNTTLSLLSDTLKKEVGTVARDIPEGAGTLWGLKTDTVLKAMMLPSDNFIAEQLLLVCSDRLGSELSTEKGIREIQSRYLRDLPDKPNWVDGSGLSRYNLFTPRDIITVLNLIYSEFRNPQNLYSMLPAGGKTGTLKNAYPKTDSPFVFGKTGSMTGVYNQSGYLITKKGRVYLFSFMNNNFLLPAADIRDAVGVLMTSIHDKF